MAAPAPTRYPFDDSDIGGEEHWRLIARNWATSGVVRDRFSELAASPVSAQRQVSIAAGEVVIDGHFGYWPAASVLDVAPNNTGNTRKDLVVVRVRRGSANRGIELDVKTGSASFPTLTQTSVVWEEALFELAVPNAFAQLSSGDITDVRPYTSPDPTGGPGSGVGLASVTQSGSAYTADKMVNRDGGVEFSTISTWWTAVTNAAVAAQTTVVYAGTQSGRMRAAANGMMVAGTLTGTSGIPVTAGSTYRGRVQVRAFSTVRQVRARLTWYDAAGVELSASNGTVSADSNSAWSTYSVEAVAPAGAAFVALQIRIDDAAINEDHFFDAAMLEQKLVPRSKLDFVDATLIDDPTNDAVRVYPSVGSEFALFTHFR